MKCDVFEFTGLDRVGHSNIVDAEPYDDVHIEVSGSFDATLDFVAGDTAGGYWMLVKTVSGATSGSTIFRVPDGVHALRVDVRRYASGAPRAVLLGRRAASQTRTSRV